VVSAGCSESQREIVEGATRWPYRDEIFSEVASSVLPRSYSDSASKISGNGYVLLLFTDNWFSHEYRNSAVITVGDWEALYAPPSLKAYLMYQVAQALIHFSAEMSEEMAMNMTHEPPQGCLYDMAADKPSIKLGMVAGNLCHKCVGQLLALGTPVAAIDSVGKIVSIVRSEALGRPIPFDPSEVFVVMRFTANDENHNAWLHGLKPGIEACGLRASRGDDRVESRYILDKVNAAIRRSRLIVAKVDENNLNVYYELGLAMGLEKDVLLISEADLAINLPADLRGWGYLAYDRGNYVQLSERVKKFLVDHYQVRADGSR
jgi:hypothetical protein